MIITLTRDGARLIGEPGGHPLLVAPTGEQIGRLMDVALDHATLRVLRDAGWVNAPRQVADISEPNAPLERSARSDDTLRGVVGNSGGPA